MTGHKVITIGRQFGSGGREIGQRLSEKLDIPLYDHRLVSMAAEQLGVRKEQLRFQLYSHTGDVRGLYKRSVLCSVF